MTRKIYVSYVEVFQGDAFDICVSFSREEAYKAGYEDRKYTRERDRKNRQWVIAECEAPVEDGQSAKDAYTAYLLNDGELSDGEYIDAAPAVKITNRDKLFESIKAAYIYCLTHRTHSTYTINEDMTLDEDDNGALDMDGTRFAPENTMDDILEYYADDCTINSIIDKLEKIELGDMVFMMP